MRKISFIVMMAVLSAGSFSGDTSAADTKKTGVEVWLTDPAANVLFQRQPDIRFVTAAATITIDTATKYQTVQNEPLNPGNNPSMIMPPAKEKAFIGNHLGPAFTKAGLKTGIIIYDHNCDEPDYPLAILDDPKAAAYIAGSAFHLYDGDISALTAVHDAHPDKGVYLTE
jgi:O-glycosyl hydrolase